MPYLLVDTSYTIFFRYYATHTWYRFAHKDDKFEDDYDWIDNKIFKEKWHARALAITLATGSLKQWNLDMTRHARECLPPKDHRV